MPNKLIVGSKEAMQHEPSLESAEFGDYEARELRKLRHPSKIREKRLEDDIFPKGIDDSMGG